VFLRDPPKPGEECVAEHSADDDGLGHVGSTGSSFDGREICCCDNLRRSRIFGK
jgi:hypothetical protein